MTSLDGNNKVLERMRIDRQGRVGIGTDDPGELLDVNGTITGRFTPVTRTITHGVSGSGEVDTYTLAANENRIVLDNAQGTAGSSRTYTANFNSGVPTEVGSIMYLEINSSRTATSAAGVNHKSEIQFNGTSVLSTGDNFIGASGTYSKTISRVVILTSTLGWQDAGLIDYLDKTISKFSGWNTHCAQFERTSDGRGGTSGYGEVLRVTKDGTYQGSLDAFNSSEFGITSDNNLVLQQKTSTDRNLVFSTSYFSPFAVDDNTIDLGRSNARFDDVYATNSSIQTSDHNEKQDIAELSDAERRVAVACKGLLRKFRWKHSVAEKGDEARTHFGIIAQDLQAAFEAEGLDAGDYGMFIHSTWRDEEKDEEGNSFEPKRWSEEKSRMGVRYGELLAFIISVIG